VESFVDQHGLWTPEQHKLAKAVEKEVAERGLGVIRFSFADQHGIAGD
jgi:glutamine synthetase